MIGRNTLKGLLLLFERKQRRSGSEGRREMLEGVGRSKRVETGQDAMYERRINVIYIPKN